MAVCPRIFLSLLLTTALFTSILQGVQGEIDEGPLECRPYIEKALKEKELETGDTPVESTQHIDHEEIVTLHESSDESVKDGDQIETVNEDVVQSNVEELEPVHDEEVQSDQPETAEVTSHEELKESVEADETTETPESVESAETAETTETIESTEEVTEMKESLKEGEEVKKSSEDEHTEEASKESVETADASAESEHVEEASLEKEASVEERVSAETVEKTEDGSVEQGVQQDAPAQEDASMEQAASTEETSAEQSSHTEEAISAEHASKVEEATSNEHSLSTEEITNVEHVSNLEETASIEHDSSIEETASVEHASSVEEAEHETIAVEHEVEEQKSVEDLENLKSKSAEQDENIDKVSIETEEILDKTSVEIIDTEIKDSVESHEEVKAETETHEGVKSEESESEASTGEEPVHSSVEEVQETEKESSEQKSAEVVESVQDAATSVEVETSESKSSESETAPHEEEKIDEPVQQPETETLPVEELTQEMEIPENLRTRDHVNQYLHLNEEDTGKDKAINKVADVILKELKRLYENAIKPLEILYKYRDLSNRHFGDSEIFSKPLVLFMGPWSGGKSSIINYLLDNEYTPNSLRTGAEPSPAYFNILMWGEEPEVLDGTQLAADWTFSGLQKFGQGLEERLRGLKLPSKLLEKVNIVEIPGILEVRKQVSRVFPFNDACQWFIDRADIIFLVYDPSKLDVGPETEAILDQLKGREYQTRIILNKADQVKPEELMRVQGALIWNISPLMSSAQPPVMYTTSLWSRPYEQGAPTRLLQAQEVAFLKDLQTAVDKRIENKISSARRFAVRVRNHAKMVDCYLTTYYNHKSVFGNKKLVSDQIIEHPQDYHIYEGLSTLTNISRYDLPDPDVYRDFFRLNPLYDFQQLSATCTYFRGCPINRLDVAIAYDLPELVSKYKKMAESAISQIADANKS